MTKRYLMPPFSASTKGEVCVPRREPLLFNLVWHGKDESGHGASIQTTPGCTKFLYCVI